VLDVLQYNQGYLIRNTFFISDEQKGDRDVAGNVTYMLHSSQGKIVPVKTYRGQET
jgi:hypothetical protein